MKGFATALMVGLLGLIVPTGAQARVQFDIGARLGYAIPTGRVGDHPAFLEAGVSDAVDNFIVGAVPIGLEAGVRVIPMLTLGVFAELGLGALPSRIRDNCSNADLDCDTQTFSLGAMGHFHFRPYQTLDPWVGIGISYGALQFKAVDDEGALGETDLGGLEVPLRAGIDLKLDEKFYVGPYASFTYGRYTTFECKATDCPPAGLDRTASHGWVGFGAKLTILAY